jgi:hypothetical protein
MMGLSSGVIANEWLERGSALRPARYHIPPLTDAVTTADGGSGNENCNENCKLQIDEASKRASRVKKPGLAVDELILFVHA